MQQEIFDPYLMWLGIRHPERPPNFYRLLGVEPFEADLDVIATAADRQMAHVRRFQNGERSRWSQQLLNELAAARVCLLRPADKSLYDQQLREVISASGRNLAAASSGIVNDRWIRRQRQAQARQRILQTTVVAVAFAICAVAFVLMRRQQQAGQFKDKPDEIYGINATDTTDVIVGTDTTDSTDRSDLSPPDSHGSPTSPASHSSGSVPPPSSRKQKPGEQPAAPPPEPAKSGEGSRNDNSKSSSTVVEPPERRADLVQFVAGKSTKPTTYARLRKALESRALGTAWQEWDLLKREANTYEQKDAVDRVRVLLFQMERFWQAVDGGIALLKPGATLQVQGRVMSVTKIDAQKIVLKVDDANQEVLRDGQKMDGNFAALMATLYLTSKGGAPQPLVASFMAIDAAGNPKTAQALRQDTQHRGFAVP